MQESRDYETTWESPYLLGFEIPISALKKSRQGEKCVYKPRWIERTKNVHVVFICPVSHNIWSAQFKGSAGPNII